jgi:hypothetical protein
MNRWVKHVANMEGDEFSHEVVVGKPEGKGLPGRPGCRGSY